MRCFRATVVAMVGVAMVGVATVGGVVGQKPSHVWEFSQAKLDRLRGSLRGPGQLLQPPLPEALVFRSRADRFLVSNSIRRAGLPKQAITVSAWVMVDAPRTWGGLFSALQDNGEFEKGILLGYRGSKFCFSLASLGADDGDGKMTYITGRSSFAPGRFQHIVGTYDGRTMRLYVDGKLEASSTAQHGPILYPRRAVVEIGAYHDDDEDYPFRGLIGRVRLYAAALDAKQIEALRAEGVSRFAWPPAMAPAAYRWTAQQAGLVATAGEIRMQASDRVPFDDVSGPPSLQLDDATSLRATIPALRGSTRTIEATVMFSSSRRRASIVRCGELELGLLDGKLRFGVGDRFATVGDKVAPFHWYHIVGRWDGSLLQVFVDGVPRAFNRSGVAVVRTGREVVVGDGLAGNIHEVAISNELPTAEAVGTLAAARSRRFPKPLELSLGPWASFVSPSKAEIRWSAPVSASAASSAISSSMAASFVELVDVDGRVQRVPVRHEDEVAIATVTRLRSGLAYDYRIVATDQAGKQHATAAFRLDTAFAYADDHLAAVVPDSQAVPVLAAMPKGPGYTVVIGGEYELAAKLAKYTEQQILVVRSDRARVGSLRASLAQAGLYGARVTVLQVSGRRLPLGSEFANVVVIAAGAAVKVPVSELHRILQPAGLLLDHRGKLLHTVAQKAGAGDWTHQYGSGTNTASSADRLVADELELQWFGRPGPRPMMDRGARSPAPLYTRGRLFIHGDRRLFGLDAYNGTILWAHEIPDLRRVNMPRDCSNLNAFGEYLFVAVKDRLWRLDAPTGRLRNTLEIPVHLRPAEDPAWGFIHASGDAVIGTATTVHATYRGAEGEWYDKRGAAAEAVLATSMFAVDQATGECRWSYEGTAIIHPTITVGRDTIYFVEDRSPARASLNKGRLVSQDGNNQFLVALELPTGNRLWERRHDFRKFSQVFYLSASRGVLVAVGTSGHYHVHAFEASTGQPMWRHDHEVAKDHHGGAMQHPVIVGGVVYVERKALDLHQGKVLREDVPGRRGCGTMTASGTTLYFRDYDHTIWNPATNKLTVLPGIRSGCWLSLLPAGGLLLAPESSSGCSCANPIQTSVAYRPKSR